MNYQFRQTAVQQKTVNQLGGMILQALADVPLHRAATKRILPLGMKLTDQPTGTLFIVDYTKTSFTIPYKEAALLIKVKTPFGQGVHCPWMVVDDDTALILKVHTSKYRVLGFTEAVSAEELVEITRERNIPVLEDLGSGLLTDLTAQGLPREPTVREALAKGIDVVTFSGDKLLGGPQAGLIVGRKEVVDILRKHPMARALRSDKLTLAALEATLKLYLDPQKALQEIPTLRMLATPAEDLKQRCDALLPEIKKAIGDTCMLEVVSATSTVGGGALPLTELPGWAIALQPKEISINTLVRRLRETDPAVVGRVQDNRLLIDPRTLDSSEDKALTRALQQAFIE